mmetsp:Transcript_5548/g.12399  ORF Transcript_5548/g.12399 Transcript_5548/m.12399 type:complete len:111 (+) Transcript_5548:3-335(+)
MCTTTAAAKFPYKGMGHGGHPNVLQKEPAMAKVWTNYKASPEIIPVIGCVAFAMALATYKICVVDAGAPDTHFLPSERSTLDYIENDRDASRAANWGNTAFHKGPAIVKN